MEGSDDLPPVEAELPPDALPVVLRGGSRSIPYEQFIAERHKIIDARSRTRQRVDQLVTGGAAGALVLSITFLEKIAPNPAPESRPLLLGAWGLLLLSLGLTLGSHYASCSAFDRYLTDFDHAYATDTECTAENPSTRWSRWLDAGGAVAFVIGVALLATFAFANVRFAPPSQSLPPTTESPSVREEARPAPTASATLAPAATAPGAGGAGR